MYHINDLEKCYKYDESEYRKKAKYTLAEAKKFPQWYKNAYCKEILKNRHNLKNIGRFMILGKKNFTRKKGAKSGTRYYCMEQLMIIPTIALIVEVYLQFIKNKYKFT